MLQATWGERPPQGGVDRVVFQPTPEPELLASVMGGHSLLLWSLQGAPCKSHLRPGPRPRGAPSCRQGCHGRPRSPPRTPKGRPSRLQVPLCHRAPASAGARGGDDARALVHVARCLCTGVRVGWSAVPGRSARAPPLLRRHPPPHPPCRRARGAGALRARACSRAAAHLLRLRRGRYQAAVRRRGGAGLPVHRAAGRALEQQPAPQVRRGRSAPLLPCTPPHLRLLGTPPPPGTSAPRRHPLHLHTPSPHSPASPPPPPPLHLLHAPPPPAASPRTRARSRC